MDAPYVWDHISEGKVCIKNPKTCGPSKWVSYIILEEIACS